MKNVNIVKKKLTRVLGKCNVNVLFMGTNHRIYFSQGRGNITKEAKMHISSGT